MALRLLLLAALGLMLSFSADAQIGGGGVEFPGSGGIAGPNTGSGCPDTGIGGSGIEGHGTTGIEFTGCASVASGCPTGGLTYVDAQCTARYVLLWQ